MSTAIVQSNAISPRPMAGIDDRHGVGFLLLQCVIATLFIRPADLLPTLDSWPIYQFLIACCLAVSFRAVLRQLAQHPLGSQPVLACLLALMTAIMLSHLSHGFIWGARMSALEFCKLLAIFLLITGVVRTPLRLVVFLKTMTLAILAVAVLALLDREGVLSVAALESIRDRGSWQGEAGEGFVQRLRGTGIFQDPNDFGLILVSGLILSAGFWLRPRAGWPRHLWVLPMLLLLWALAATHSRGAFLSLALAIPAAVSYARGIRVGALSTLWLPALALIFSNRMTDLNAVHEGTGQSRLQIWSESLSIWKQSPVFGLGEGLLVEELGVVAHNSYLQCFAELGAVGGMAFIGCFLGAAGGLWELRRSSSSDPTREQRERSHWRIVVFTVVVAYAGGMLTLSRQFVTPTYLILGTAVAAQVLADAESRRMQVDNRFLLLVATASLAAVLGFYLIVRIFVAWA